MSATTNTRLGLSADVHVDARTSVRVWSSDSYDGLRLSGEDGSLTIHCERAEDADRLVRKFVVLAERMRERAERDAEAEPELETLRRQAPTPGTDALRRTLGPALTTKETR